MEDLTPRFISRLYPGDPFVAAKVVIWSVVEE